MFYKGTSFKIYIYIEEKNFVSIGGWLYCSPSEVYCSVFLTCCHIWHAPNDYLVDFQQSVSNLEW